MAKSVKAPIAACLACAWALVLLALASYKVGPLARLDGELLRRLIVERESTAQAIAEVFAHLADPLPLAAILIATCALAIRWGRRRQALAALIVVAGANLTTQALKLLLSHPRYQPFLGDHQPWSNAFPSGHATAAASVAAALLLIAPRHHRTAAAVLGAGFVAVVSLAVVLLEWHYPSDVAGGILVATGWGFAALAGLRLAARLDPAPPPQASSRLAISTK